MKPIVLVSNLDTVKNKNCYQFKAMERYGFQYVIFAYAPDLSTEEGKFYEYHIYQRSLFKRMKDTIGYLFRHRKSIHHIELYTGSGGFLLFEFLLGKLLGIPVCVVERGSPLKDLDSHYGRIGRAIRKLIYRRADRVWIRELWMKESLLMVGRRDSFFLSNCIDIPEAHCHTAGKEIEFLWCNSLKKWRNSDWFVDALHHPHLRDKTATLVGFLDGNPAVAGPQDYVTANKPANLEILPFSDPKAFFLKSRFFVLPADIVFLNFALLEAMAHGVVPIVSDVQGTREIVTDGEDGLVVPHSRQALAQAMTEASRISDADYERLSRNAREKVIRTFSIESWAAKLNALYREMERS